MSVYIPELLSKTAKIMTIPLALGALGYGYKQTNFDAKTCFVDIDKNSGALDPGLNWDWDCNLTVTDPSPRMPSGSGQADYGKNPCEDYPVYWDTNKTILDRNFNVIENTNGQNSELSSYSAIRRILRERHDGAVIQSEQ